MDVNKIKAKISDLNNVKKKTYDKKRHCFLENCSQTAINSHIMQSNGIINKIALDNHVYKYNFDFFNGGISFKKIGIKKAFSIKGFCNQHDSMIFAPIELESFDPFSYHAQLLFTYRAYLYEYRKKEFTQEWMSTLFTGETNTKQDQLFMTLSGYDIGKDCLNQVINEIQEDLTNSTTDNFTFTARLINKIPIIASAIFPLETEGFSGTLNSEMDETEYLSKMMLPDQDLVVHIFPYLNQTCIIVGYCNNYSGETSQSTIKEFEKKSDNEIFNLISNILLLNSESWICSTDFYRKNIQPSESKISEMISQYSNNNLWSYETKLNIFERD